MRPHLVVLCVLSPYLLSSLFLPLHSLLLPPLPPPPPPRSALYANNLYLSQYRTLHPTLLACNTQGGPRIIGDVMIHPSAQIHPSAVVSHVTTAPPPQPL